MLLQVDEVNAINNLYLQYRNLSKLLHDIDASAASFVDVSLTLPSKPAYGPEATWRALGQQTNICSSLSEALFEAVDYQESVLRDKVNDLVEYGEYVKYLDRIDFKLYYPYLRPSNLNQVKSFLN